MYMRLILLITLSIKNLKLKKQTIKLLKVFLANSMLKLFKFNPAILHLLTYHINGLLGKLYTKMYISDTKDCANN